MKTIITKSRPQSHHKKTGKCEAIYQHAPKIYAEVVWNKTAHLPLRAKPLKGILQNDWEMLSICSTPLYKSQNDGNKNAQHPNIY